jgi:hypothetical protein
MRLDVHLTGVTPLVMENPRLSDPDDSFTRDIKSITSKATRTEDDRREIERLEFLGSLYLAEDIGPHVPGLNIRGCWVEGGKARKLGTAIERSAIVLTLSAPVEYDGPREAEGLWKNGTTYKFRAMVGLGSGRNKRRVPRMRPMFSEWELSVEVELLSQFLDRSAFVDVVSSSGMMVGLGGARRIGYGRYTAVVKG